MSYLVDTNVLSELTRPRPAPSVAAWFEEVGDDALHLSVLSLGELRDVPGLETINPWSVEPER